MSIGGLGSTLIIPIAHRVDCSYLHVFSGYHYNFVTFKYIYNWLEVLITGSNSNQWHPICGNFYSYKYAILINLPFDNEIFFENKKLLYSINHSTNLRVNLTSLTGGSLRTWGGFGTFFLGKGFILIFRSSIMVSPFSSPTSAGSFDNATSSSCLSRGKYRGSNLPQNR